MTLKKSEKRLLVILGVVVIAFLVNQFVLTPKSKKTSAASRDINSLASGQIKPGQSVKSQQVVQQPDRIRFENWGRDPFSTSRSLFVASNTKKQKSKPVLQGIFWKQGKAYALINDQVLCEGEEDSGLKVDRIRGMEVLCSQGSRTYTLHWRESP